MTNKEILDLFCQRYGIKVTDYRPLHDRYIPKAEGIVLWTENNDTILFFPKEEAIVPLKLHEMYMVKKIRPRAKVERELSCDGVCYIYKIAYFCPTCGKTIPKYKCETACSSCGTIYDWGYKEPEIVIDRSVEW